MPLTQQILSQSIFSFLSRAGRLSILIPLLASSLAYASVERDQARRMHDRLAGVPPTNAVLAEMESLIIDNKPEEAAAIAMQNDAFYNVTLKNFAAPWTNEAQSVFVPLNDYTATVVGMIRDDINFSTLLSADLVYTYVGNDNNVPPVSINNNDHYIELEKLGPVAGNLADKSLFDSRAQSSIPNNIPAEATAGVMTSRAAAQAFFSDGTNRAMFRFTLMNHLCTDLEPLKDVSRVPDRVRQDVSRSPGGDSRIFMFSCVGCHAGMDGLTGAFSKYNFDTSVESGALAYNLQETPDDSSLNGFSANGISNKYHNNADNFKPGYITEDESWINYWRNGQNALLGWSSSPVEGTTFDARGHAVGTGAKSMGRELANSRAFASCQVKKAFKAVCFRDSDNYANDRAEVESITSFFMNNNYNMKSVFAKVAAHCM